MSIFRSIAVVLALVFAVLAVIIGLSLASLLREEERLVDDFAAETRQQARASAELLAERLEALDQDTRMLTDLVERPGRDKDIDAATEQRVWEGAFHAMAVVVAHYRTIALFEPDGTLRVMAGDPTETVAMVAAMVEPSRRLAREVSATQTRAMGQTERYGERSFLLYGTPVRGGRAIVVASDAVLFLGAVAWLPAPSAHLYVTDPAGVVWADCETPAGCHATPASHAPAPPPADTQLRLTARGTRTVRPAASEIQVSETVDRPTGRWTVTWLASTREIQERHRSMILRIVLTALAAALAVGAGGLMVMRQQRRAAELEGRLRYAQALASARQTSQSIVENAPLGVLGVSQDGRVVLANSFLTDRLGTIRIGAPLGEAFPDAEADWVRTIQPMLLAERAPDAAAGPGAAGVLHELRSVGTGVHQFHVRVVPVPSREFGINAFALVEDRSELRNLENQLVRAEKLITVGVLSAGIAHEIGSPLAVIRGRAEQVLRALSSDRGASEAAELRSTASIAGGLEPSQGSSSRVAEDLRVIIKHIDNISSTIRQVLDFSRRQPAQHQAVALDAVVSRACALLQWKSDAKKLAVDLALDPDLPLLAADPDQLQQVLVNLLLNGCDASEAGGRLMVRARGTREGVVQIEVIDRGCGIAPEHMHTVFDPFFTTKKRGEGTGLGLPIAASIVRNHGGQINLASTPGKGTTVTVIWPAAAPAQGALEARNAHA